MKTGVKGNIEIVLEPRINTPGKLLRLTHPAYVVNWSLNVYVHDFSYTKTRPYQ